MRKCLFISFCLLLCAGAVDAQGLACDSTDFCALVAKVEANYAGFPTKVNEQTRCDYDSMKSRLYQSVLRHDRPGYDAAAEYVAWFNDYHLAVGALSQQYMKARVDYDSIKYEPKFAARAVDDNTFLIKIPSFNYEDSIVAFVKDAVVKAKASRAENVIIDIRGNGGGLDYTYTPLLELVYDKPFYIAGVEFRATPDIANLLRDAYKAQNGNPPWALAMADSIDTGKFDFIAMPMPSEASSLDSILEYPRKVAIIIDGNVASAAEQFLILTKACSNRTTIYGKDNTLGAIDYSNVMPFELPCSTISCHIPTSRTVGITASAPGYDGIGIAPDQRIPLPYPPEISANIDPWINWVSTKMKQ